MDHDFWHRRWQQNKIGFHQPDKNEQLLRHWPSVAQSRLGPVLVPLCGKSLDMRWLAGRGHNVTGIELSALAIADFYSEWGKTPHQDRLNDQICYAAANVQICHADFFEFRARTPYPLFYDRAALIALPPQLRSKYLAHLRSLLTKNARGLVITLEYDQRKMNGPPFAVNPEELAEAAGFRFRLLKRTSIPSPGPKFAQRSIRSLHEACWLAFAR